MQPKVIIVWFKRDLRVFDHAPLVNAVHDADFVLPLFVVEPDYWRLPTSSRRHWCFVNDCLHELNANLAALGQRLILRIGEMLPFYEHGLESRVIQKIICRLLAMAAKQA